MQHMPTQKAQKIQIGIAGEIASPIISSFRNVNTLGNLPPDSVCVFMYGFKTCICSITFSSD